MPLITGALVWRISKKKVALATFFLQSLGSIEVACATSAFAAVLAVVPPPRPVGPQR